MCLKLSSWMKYCRKKMGLFILNVPQIHDDTTHFYQSIFVIVRIYFSFYLVTQYHVNTMVN